MKKLLLLFTFATMACALNAQMEISRSVSYVLEKYEKQGNHDDIQDKIRCALIRTITEADSSTTFEIEISMRQAVDKETSNGRDGNGQTYSNIRRLEFKTGSIAFHEAEFKALLEFEDDLKQKSKPPQINRPETTWNLKIGDRFEAKYTFLGSERWTYFWTIDEATYEFSATEHNELHQKLRVIAKLME